MLRRLVEQGPEGIGGWFARWWARRLQLGISVLVVLALGGIAWALSDSAKVGGWFALLFTIALVVLLVLAAVALWTLRFLLNRVRLRLPSFAAAWAGESLSAGEPVGGGAGGAGHGRDADSGGLPDAGGAVARSARDGFAQAAECFSGRCDDG